MRTTSLAGLIGASVLIVASAIAAEKITETREVKIATAPGLPLTVKTSNGGIEIIPTDSSEMRIKATVYARHKERLESVHVSASNDADSGNDVHVDFPAAAQGEEEGCSLVIEVPRAKNIRLVASNGAISVRGTAGTASLETSNGGVTVKEHDGEATVQTSNGPVTIASLNGKASIKTSNGPVTLTRATHAFQINSSNAPVTVATDRGFSGEISASTSNGRISVPKGAKVLSDAGKKGIGNAALKVAIGDGTESSTIRTSNAPVTIRAAE